MKKNIPDIPKELKIEWPDENYPPQISADYRTKLCQRAQWKSWGLGGYYTSNDNPPVKKLLRYPRAFLCRLENNGIRTVFQNHIFEARYDLYDIGAQRHLTDNDDSLLVYPTVCDGEDWFVGVAADISVFYYSSIWGNAYALLPVEEFQDGTKGTATLFFTGPWCELRVFRKAKGTMAYLKAAAADKEKMLDDDNTDDSPPPPDPGDDGSEVAALRAEIKELEEKFPQIKKSRQARIEKLKQAQIKRLKDAQTVRLSEAQISELKQRYIIT